MLGGIDLSLVGDFTDKEAVSEQIGEGADAKAYAAALRDLYPQIDRA